MHNPNHQSPKSRLQQLSNRNIILFHIIGIICLLWFTIRTLPAPHRIQYPCQQISLSIALTYVAFWGALLTGLIIWVKHAKHKTTAYLPTIIVACILLFTITGMVFASHYNIPGSPDELTWEWNPVPNQPIGTPVGYNPGRVVWTWNPDSTEKNLDGYWWETQHNNQQVIDTMYSDSLQALADEETDHAAWDKLFKYFNQQHGKGDIGYQPGEKIAIKINMNNIYYEPYTSETNEIDANPYVVKGVLHQLIDVVGVAESDITVFDASRKLPDWFYNRVYYETYPAGTLIPEFPEVLFVGADGDAPGREQAAPSDVRIYFPEGDCAYRTLPVCVAEAEYLINMPIVKRHVYDRVTLAAKNLFGVFIEPVVDIHPYHTIGFTKMGNPAPQVDLLAHEHLGGKTVLYIGDGTYACRYMNADISHFQMYPFNDDWMSSLFFSQDPVAVDSVMYDFLYADGTGPSERAQNYIHQAAQPLENFYDPENDGVYLQDSLGVHEHGDTEVNIFDAHRYIGAEYDGIDYVPLGAEHGMPTVSIGHPLKNHVYLFGKDLLFRPSLNHTIALGPLTVSATVYGLADPVEKIEFYLDDQLQRTDDSAPYEWRWIKPSIRTHIVKVIAYTTTGDQTTDDLLVWKIL